MHKLYTLLYLPLLRKMLQQKRLFRELVEVYVKRGALFVTIISLLNLMSGACRGASQPVKLRSRALQLADGSQISRAASDEYNPQVVQMPDGFLMLVFGSDRACGACTPSTHNLFAARSVAAYENDGNLPAFNVPVAFTVSGTPLNYVLAISAVASPNGANLRVYLNNASGDIFVADVSPSGPAYDASSLSPILNIAGQKTKVIGIQFSGTKIFGSDASGLYTFDPSANDASLHAMAAGEGADAILHINSAFSGMTDSLLLLKQGAFTSASFSALGGNADSINEAIFAASFEVKNASALQTGIAGGELIFISAIEPGETQQDLYVANGATTDSVWNQISPEPVSAPANGPMLATATGATLTTASLEFSTAVTATSAECANPATCTPAKYALNGGLTVNSVVSQCGAGINCKKYLVTTSAQVASTGYILTVAADIIFDFNSASNRASRHSFTGMNLSQGLLAFFPFSGNANDAMATYNPTFNNAVLAPDRFGNASSSYNFGGASRIEVAPINFSSTGVSVSAWINFTSFPGFASIIRDDSAKIAFTFAPTGNSLTFQINFPGFGYQNLAVVTNPLDYSDGNWHHVVGTYDGANFRIYRDGLEIGNSAYAFAGTLSTGTVQAIGGTSSGENCVGKVDEVRFYNRGLTATEVTGMYNLEKF